MERPPSFQTGLAEGQPAIELRSRNLLGTMRLLQPYFCCKGGRCDKQCANCVSEIEEVAGICGDGDADAGIGDWRQRCGVQRAECGGAAAGGRAECAESLHGAALSVSVAVVSGLSGSAGSKSELREPVHVQHHRSCWGGYRQESVDCMAVCGEWKLL